MATQLEPGPAESVTRILIADDHPVVRKGLRQLLESERDLVVCAESDSVAQTLSLIASEQPHLVIVDLALGAESGFEVIRRLAESQPTLRMLVLSMHDEMLYAESVLRIGAQGYIMKHVAARDLITAIRQVLSGKTYVSEALSERLLTSFARDGRKSFGLPLDRLTAREREVFEMTVRGLSVRQMAEQLGRSVKTIETHRTHVQEKLGLSSAHELMRFAVTWSRLG